MQGVQFKSSVRGTAFDIEAYRENGWFRVANAFPVKLLNQAWRECHTLKEAYYTSENLETHRVYISDCTETRISHALMASLGKPLLPHIDVTRFPAISELVVFHQSFFDLLFETESKNSRCLLNWQEYLGESKPIPEHFDGEYLRFKKGENGYSLHIDEALVPQIVMLFIEFNANTGWPEGVILKDWKTGEHVFPPSKAGDLLVFDNIRFRHLVPLLKKPRRMMGLRNFDLEACHYVRARQEGFETLNYVPMGEGWVATGADSLALQQKFLKERWPEVWAQSLRDGAVF